MKIEKDGIRLVVDIDGRESEDLPIMELIALRQALSRKNLSFVSMLYLMPRGVGVLFPQDVQDRLLNPKYVTLLNGIISALENQLELFKDLRKGKTHKDGEATSIANPAGTLKGQGEPV